MGTKQIIHAGTFLQKCLCYAVFISSVCGGGLLKAQSFSEDIPARLNEFNLKNLQEKIYVHTDKDLYLSGEIMWFKVYDVGASNHTPLEISKIAYIELLDKDQRPVMQAKVQLEHGSGSGSLHLPADLATGGYRFRAYTSWMKNFSADYFFVKDLNIVNTLAKPVNTVSATSGKYDIQFFPEGGYLVQNLSSKVGFRAVDENGKGVDIRGIVTDENDNTVALLESFKFGIGNFTFTPGLNKTYRAVVDVPGRAPIIIPMPVAKRNGIVMSLEEASEGKLKIVIESTGDTAVLLLVHTRHESKLSEKLSLNNGKGEFIIDKDKLGKGISHFTVFNRSGEPACERLYFRRPSSGLAINVVSDQRQYGKRKKVVLDIDIKNEAGVSSDADASIAVYSTNGNAGPGVDIRNYVWLTSELRGTVEDPAYYFTNLGQQTARALDNLMLTQGWRRFVWDDILNKKADLPGYLPEIDGHIIEAKLTDSRTNLPAKGILAYLSVPGKNVQLYPSRSDESGNLKFYTRKLLGPTELVAQTDYRQDSTYHIEFSSPFSLKNSSFPLRAARLSENLRAQLTKGSIANQVSNVFLAKKLDVFLRPAIDSATFYLKSDKTYMLDKFVRFNTMEEVLREFVTEVSVSRQRDEYLLWAVYKTHYNDFYRNVEPLLIFDGVPVFDRGSTMVKYDPKKIKSIDVLIKRYHQGPATFNSIVNFKSYHSNLPDFQLDRRASVIDYDGPQLRRDFYAPVYDTDVQVADRIPDFRNLLYWQPDLKIDSSGKQKLSFYTSDQENNYTIVVQGVSSSGRLGSVSSSIEVK